MTDEQINLAIHKAVGFEWNDERRLWERNANKARVVSHNPFYYSSDLNLMHEAENCLSLDDRNHYIDALGTIHTDSWEFATATARQRAEAFLRTLGNSDLHGVYDENIQFTDNKTQQNFYRVDGWCLDHTDLKEETEG